MKHRNRILLLTALLLPLVTLGAGAMLLGTLISSMHVQLDDALEQAKDTARQSATLGAIETESENDLREGFKRLQELGRQKRAVRLKIAAMLAEIRTIGNKQDALLLSEQITLRSYSREQETFAAFLRYAHVRQLTGASGPVHSAWVLRRILGFSLGESIDADLRDHALAQAREQILERLLIAHESDTFKREQLHAAAGPLGVQLAALREEHATLRQKYNQVLTMLDRAQRNLQASAEQMEQIKRDAAQVEADILSLQSELARIDGRLRAKAERELVQKGLMEDRPDRFRQRTTIGKGQFLWPASGPISAGFQDARYERYFGLPHKGIDIVVPFGTTITSASDGIVFMVRMGGATGYTYVLIGHRGGYATVYGHLSSVTVRAGDTVIAGQTIGLSGGAPGTEGAGPMTTGPHLHFEMIENGGHVDPRSVLP